jgi:hypothetical protein
MAEPGQGSLIAMIVDQDSATGLLLTGVGHSDLRKRTNFLIVDDSEYLFAVRMQAGHPHALPPKNAPPPPPRRSRLQRRRSHG